jgi:predicted GNAT family acetyltransferase
MQHLKFVRHHPAGFLDRASALLESAEADNHLMLGIATSLMDGEMTLSGAPVLATVEDGDDVTLAALRTPPHNLLLSTGTEEAVIALINGLKHAGAGVPGVTGPSALAEAFAARWAGDARTLTMRQHVYRCEKVTVPDDPGGALRHATDADAKRAIEWALAFNDEANNAGTEASVRRMVEELTEARRLFLWEHAGELVSMATARHPTPKGIRVGYVYTPADKRGRGYASAVTAGATQAMFDAGYAFCCLYADATNATANAIYQRIGYQPCGDSAMWRFRR